MIAACCHEILEDNSPSSVQKLLTGRSNTTTYHWLQQNEVKVLEKKSPSLDLIDPPLGSNVEFKDTVQEFTKNNGELYHQKIKNLLHSCHNHTVSGALIGHWFIRAKRGTTSPNHWLLNLGLKRLTWWPLTKLPLTAAPDVLWFCIWHQFNQCSYFLYINLHPSQAMSTRFGAIEPIAHSTETNSMTDHVSALQRPSQAWNVSQSMWF